MRNGFWATLYRGVLNLLAGVTVVAVITGLGVGVYHAGVAWGWYFNAPVALLAVLFIAFICGLE